MRRWLVCVLAMTCSVPGLVVAVGANVAHVRALSGVTPGDAPTSLGTWTPCVSGPPAEVGSHMALPWVVVSKRDCGLFPALPAPMTAVDALWWGVAAVRAGHEDRAIPVWRTQRVEQWFLAAAMRGPAEPGLVALLARFALATAPDDVDVAFACGRQLRLVDAAASQQALRRAAQLAPDRADIHEALGDTLMTARQPAAAAEAFAAAARLVSTRPALWQAAGEAAFYGRLFVDADRYLQRASALQPGTATAGIWRGRAALDDGRAEQAVVLLEGALGLQGTTHELALGWYELGRARVTLGRGVDAVDAFRRALKIDPDFTYAPAARSALDALGAGGAR
jgi:cytochrome c-type biogenesis protein CcmH/NrfG